MLKNKWERKIKILLCCGASGAEKQLLKQ